MFEPPSNDGLVATGNLDLARIVTGVGNAVVPGGGIEVQAHALAQPVAVGNCPPDRAAVDQLAAIRGRASAPVRTWIEGPRYLFPRLLVSPLARRSTSWQCARW